MAHDNIAVLISKSTEKIVKALNGEALRYTVEDGNIFVVYCAGTDHEAIATFSKENFEKHYGMPSDPTTLVWNFKVPE